jgi:hypothetical protein
MLGMGIKVLGVSIVLFAVLTDVVLYLVTVGLNRTVAETQV